MSRWDAARAASKRPLRKYKPCGPVYPEGLTAIGLRCAQRRRDEDLTCRQCGHVLCSCPPKPLMGCNSVTTGAGYRCLGCKRGAACTFVSMGLRSCQQVADERAIELEPTQGPRSSCFFGTVTGKAFHSYDCGRGEHRCALAVTP